MTTEPSGAEPPAEPGTAGDGPARVSSKRSLFKDPVPWLLLAAAYGLDQLTKALVVGNLSYGESWPEHGFLRITYVWNTGTAFSLFQDQGGPLTVFSLVAVFALYFIYRSLEAPNIWVRMAFGLLLGGAFGNLTDRLREGHVIDFIDVGPWPVFNIADSSIVVGIAVLFLYFWMNSDKSKKDRAEPGKPPVSGGPQDHPSGG